MLRVLSKEEKEELQKRGYMYEHLLCFYSMVATKTFLYNESHPVFLTSFGEADLILFGLGKTNKAVFECVKEVAELPISTLNIVAPTTLQGLPNLATRHIDWDFHIDVSRFDLSLRGSKYKDLRYRVKQAEKMGYSTKVTREFTPKHTYILSRHMARRNYDVWDCEELLSLDRFFREHTHGLVMEAYRDDMLIGYDVVDFFEENKIMVVPLGIYLRVPLISYYMMYQNLEYAKENGYEWVDIGPSCGVDGLREFKEKWFGQPKYKICVQTLSIKPNDYLSDAISKRQERTDSNRS